MVVQEGNDVGFGGDTGARPECGDCPCGCGVGERSRRAQVGRGVEGVDERCAECVAGAGHVDHFDRDAGHVEGVVSGCDAAPVCAERDDHDLGGTTEQSTDHRLAGTTGAVALGTRSG